MRGRVASFIFAVAFKVIRHAVPAMVRLIIEAFLLMIASIVAIFTGARKSVDLVATRWTEEAMTNIRHDPIRPSLYRFFQSMAWLALITGWVLTAIATVGLLSLAF